MFKPLIAIAATYLAFCPTVALADEDGNELLAQCNVVLQLLDGGRMQPEDALGAGQCLGFMQATKDLNRLYQIRDQRNALFCVPKDGINNGQATRIVVKYLRDHPEDLHKPNIILATAAFRDAYPCASKR